MAPEWSHVWNAVCCDFIFIVKTRDQKCEANNQELPLTLMAFYSTYAPAVITTIN